MKNRLPLFIALCLLISCSKKSTDQRQNPDISAEMEALLNEHLLNVWYPRAIDTGNGGFYSTFTYDWKKTGEQNKFIVTQARHVWTLSFVYENYAQEEKYLKYARHGVDFLKSHFWDKELGGFFELTDSVGNVTGGENKESKRAYGNAFAIYALAQYYKVTQQEDVLTLAKKAFLWLEEHSYDKAHGGYFQVLHRDGSPVMPAEAENFNPFDRASIGIKDFNSSIHLLEAFTSLYQVWPDTLVKKRLKEMYDIVAGPMYDDRGFLKLYFYPDWTLVPDGDPLAMPGRPRNFITFGHDVETAFLLYEAAEALEIDKTDLLAQMKKMVDHALKYGWDSQSGGFYDQGKYEDGQMNIINPHKEWWGQAEGLNTFLLMHKLFPGNEQDYYKKFEKQWDYINRYLIDRENKGWYPSGIDKNPDAKKALKAQIWKGNYHTSRALVTCLKSLENPGH